MQYPRSLVAKARANKAAHQEFMSALYRSGASRKRARTASASYMNLKRRRTNAWGPARGPRYRKRNLVTMGLLGVERKFYDTQLVATNLVAPTDATGGEFDPSATSMISTPAQGDGAQNRDGKRIVIESVQIEGTVGWANSEDQVDPFTWPEVFIALVLDTQSNATQINSEDVFTNSNTANLATRPLRNMAYAERFKVLRVVRFRIDPVEMNVAASNKYTVNAGVQGWSIFKSFKGGLPVNFTATGTTASIANVTDNSLHIIAYATSTSLTPFINYNARIRFVG